MKLRVRSGSLRLRLTRGEVDRVAAGAVVEERVSFPGGPALHVHLESSPVAERVGARLVLDGDAHVHVTLPAGVALRWATGDEEGVEASVGEGEAALRVLVQKDYACLAPRAGDEDADAFPHPEAGRRAC